MRRILRRAVWLVGGALTLVVVLLAAHLLANLARSEARGARPLHDLAVRGDPSVREAARAGLAVLDTATGFRDIEWVAVIDRRPHRDTLVLGLFRAEDATVMRRMLMPHPYVSGVVRYDSVHHRLAYAGVGID